MASNTSPRRRWRRSTFLPVILLIYLGVMAWIGRGEFLAGNYVYYFTIIGLTLVCIILLHFFLRRRERLADERRSDLNREKK